MKKKINAVKSNTLVVPQHQSFRRFVRQMFTSLLMRQSHNEKVLEMLQDIGDSIEIIAREMARQAKSSE